MLSLDQGNEEEGSLDTINKIHERPIENELKETVLVGGGRGKGGEVGTGKHHIASSNRDESLINIAMVMKGSKSYREANINVDDDDESGDNDYNGDGTALLNMLSNNDALMHGGSMSSSDQLRRHAVGSSGGPFSDKNNNNNNNNNNDNDNDNDNTLSRLTANLHGALRRR